MLSDAKPQKTLLLLPRVRQLLQLSLLMIFQEIITRYKLTLAEVVTTNILWMALIFRTNRFLRIDPNEYFVTVRDKNGCNPAATKRIYVLDYPKYFTPNGDGIHDIWEIKNLWFYPNATISIFDRLGKFLYRFRGNQPGWNGKFNEKELFASDYWFVIEMENGKTIKGHFALMR